MAYIGTPPQSGFITTAKQRVTGSTNNYVDLDNSISSLADVIVWVNSVKQDSTNLTLTTSTRITLGDTLTASDVVEIAYLGKAVATQTPDTGTVTNDMLAGSIANSKLANSSITLNGSAVSLGGSATVDNTPVFSISRSNDQSGVSDATDTRVQFNSIQFDPSSGWDGTNYWWVVPTGQGGKYYISFGARMSSGGTAKMDACAVHLFGGASGTTPMDSTQHSSLNHNFDYLAIGRSGIYELTAGDKINVVCWVDNDGGTSRIDGNGSYNYTTLKIAKIIE